MMKKLLLTIILTVAFATSPLFSQTVEVGDVAPDFIAPTSSNNDFSLYETVNDSIVVIFFMGYS
jgi:hypothetical protein